MTEQLQKPQPQKVALQEGAKPPIPFWRAKNRADAILDLASTSPSKVELAKEAIANNNKTIAYFDKKIEEAEKAGNTIEAAELQKKRDFTVDLFEYVQSLFRAFDRKKKSFNTKKDNLQKDLEDKLQKTPFLKVLQKLLPWLGGAVAGGAVVGSGIWTWFTGHMQNVFPSFDSANVKEIINLSGLLVLGGASYGIDSIVTKRRSKLSVKCAAKKDIIDSEEDEIRENVLKLVEIEYDRLAKVSGYQPFKLIEDVEHAHAHTIVKEMEKKYKIRLPIPDSLLNGEAFQSEIGRWRGFFQKSGEAFASLSRKK